MSKEQIEEMAKAICSACAIRENCKLEDVCRATLQESETLYNAGYRKQSEGEWIVAKTERAWNDAEYPYMHRCSLCGNEVASQDLTQYCSYCGAKMKGGAE